MFLETFPDGVIKEDCESLCYMIERTTSIGQYAIYINQLQTKLGRQAN